MTREPELAFAHAMKLSDQWDRCAEALMRKDTQAFDREMARFWMMSNQSPERRECQLNKRLPNEK